MQHITSTAVRTLSAAPYLYTVLVIGLPPPFFVLVLAASSADGGPTVFSTPKTGKGATSKVRRIDALLTPCVDRLQSVRPREMVLLLLPLPVAHPDRGDEGPYLGRLHAPFPHRVLVHAYRLPPSPPRSPFAADATARRWI